MDSCSHVTLGYLLWLHYSFMVGGAVWSVRLPLCFVVWGKQMKAGKPWGKAAKRYPFWRHLVTGLIYREIMATQTKAFPSSVMTQGHSACQLQNHVILVMLLG